MGCVYFKTVLKTLIWRLQVQSWLQVSNNTGILNTCTRLWLTESEQSTPVGSIKDVVRSSVKVPEFDKHLKNTGGQISQNVVEIALQQLNRNAASNIEQVLEAAPYKAVAVRPLTTHHEKYPS